MKELIVLFEDKNIIVCEKPVGVHSEEKDGSLDMLKLIREHKTKNGEDTYVGIVHRLDVTTGGVVLYAKNKKTAAKYSAVVGDKEKFKKEYYAVIHGEIQENKGIMEDFLFKDSRKNKSFVVKKMRNGVKKASLEYELVDTVSYNEKTISLVRIKLHTGRTHQIRVQFSSRGFPLLGDGKYGSKDNKCETALWAYKLTTEVNTLKNTHEEKEFVSYPDLSNYPWNLFKDYLKGN